MNEFRQECRAFAQHWITVQAAEFQRLGVMGDFDNPYTTMNFHAEARIAGELLKFAMSRPALSRVKAGDVERSRAHGAGRGRDRVS
jgi:isoleucyl-tRNA synthetase